MERPHSRFFIGLVLGLLVSFVILGLASSPRDAERIANAAHRLQVQILTSRISDLEKQVEDLKKDKEKSARFLENYKKIFSELLGAKNKLLHNGASK